MKKKVYVIMAKGYEDAYWYVWAVYATHELATEAMKADMRKHKDYISFRIQSHIFHEELV